MTTEEPARPAEPQTAAVVAMIRPAAFSRNEVTRPSNRFQSAEAAPDAAETAAAALAEFDALAGLLTQHGVDVHVFAGRAAQTLPDEVFPNNWLSTHANGTVVLYPLMAWNRRPERRRDVLDDLQQHGEGFRIDRVVDLTKLEDAGHFLEGTGSLVLDRANRIGFACLSPRTHVEALRAFARELDYGIVTFEAGDRDGHALYHTNVMLSLGERFAVVCLSAIRDIEERYRVLNRLEKSNREVVELNYTQLHSFAGNLIELKGTSGNVIVLSTRAAASLKDDQRAALGRHGTLVTANIDTIETYGGGSVRCMLAEVFLPRKPRGE
jgi:hypothetical protein